MNFLFVNRKLNSHVQYLIHITTTYQSWLKQNGKFWSLENTAISAEQFDIISDMGTITCLSQNCLHDKTEILFQQCSLMKQKQSYILVLVCQYQTIQHTLVTTITCKLLNTTASKCYFETGLTAPYKVLIICSTHILHCC